MSFVNLNYHIVFRTKGSRPAILIAHEDELYHYVWGYVKNIGGKLYRIGGMPDHLHIFVSLSPELAVANFVRDLKTLTSKYLKANAHFPDFEGWAEGYAAFSYSQNDVSSIVAYIMNQKEHHRTVSFAEEYREFIVQNGCQIDTRFFLKN